AVPEGERLGLLKALGVQVVGDLEDDLSAVRQPRRCDELRVRRKEGLAELELPGQVQCAPWATTGNSRTSSYRSASSWRQASASSAQTITVGPEPESVAPTAPRGSSARISSRTDDGRYGWCNRSSNAAASQSAFCAAMPAPSRAARATLNDA